MKEEWKDIKGFEGYYQISSNGRIYSLKKKICKVPDKSNKGGYLRVQLINDNSRKKYFIHRLVAEAFVAGYFEGANVNHKDFNIHNNKAENLEWVTKKQNTQYSLKKGRFKNNSFKRKPHFIEYDDGKIIKCESVLETAQTLGISRAALINQIRYNGGIFKRFNCRVYPCVSNDYSERKYNQAIGNGSNRC